MKFILSTKSYTKMILHCWKYPHESVEGIFIGKLSEDQVIVEDSFPLFHGTPLAPFIEITLNQIDKICEKNSLQIVGNYSANVLLEDNDILSVTASHLGLAIKNNFPNAHTILIQNNQLSASPSEDAISVFKFNDPNWKKQDGNFLKDSNEAFKSVEESLKKKLHWKLVDFTDHLDDITYDWRNDELFD